MFADLQVVSNLIYYRYMNPAIVAPDAFDIVSMGVDKGLTPDQVDLLLTLDYQFHSIHHSWLKSLPS